jgi:hypothetical protein
MLKRVLTALFILMAASRAIAAEPWAEVRFGYGSYGMVTSEPTIDGVAELYLGDEEGPNWEGRVGYTGSSTFSPGVAITRYTAGSEGRSSSWALSALLAFRTREPHHFAGFGVDLSLGWVWPDFEEDRIEGYGANISLAAVLEPQFDDVSFPIFLGVRYAPVRNARLDGQDFDREGTLDYSGIFFGVGARYGWSQLDMH